MANATNITYGSYDFQASAGPVPILTIVKNFNRTEDGSKLNTKFTATLAGEINFLPSGVDGYVSINTRQQEMYSGFLEDCQEFIVSCDGNVLIQQYPRVNSITFSPSPDNWSQSSDFNIELEWDGEDLSGYNLDSISETWDFQIDNQSSFYDWALTGTGDNSMHLFSLSHNISAKATTTCIGAYSGIPGWKEARRYVITQLGYDSDKVENSGVFNLNTSEFSGWNHSRVQQIGEHDGTFSVTETWLVADINYLNNAGKAIEDFTATTNFDANNGLTTVSINGTIQGIENISYGTNPGDYTIEETKYDNASGFWSNIQLKLPGRASLIGGSNVNIIPINTSVGHNPTKGVINYAYTYDTRPCNFITGALVETISVSDDNPTDVFAEIAILGRSYGPVLQNLSTVTSSKRTVNISAIMGPTTGCSDIINSINAKPNVDSLLCALYQDISGAGTQVYKNQDNETWDFKTGSYNRTVSWVFVNCTGAAPSTLFC